MRVAHDGIELNVDVQGPEGGPVVAFLHVDVQLDAIMRDPHATSS